MVNCRWSLPCPKGEGSPARGALTRNGQLTRPTRLQVPDPVIPAHHLYVRTAPGRPKTREDGSVRIYAVGGEVAFRYGGNRTLSDTAAIARPSARTHWSLFARNGDCDDTR